MLQEFQEKVVNKTFSLKVSSVSQIVQDILLRKVNCVSILVKIVIKSCIFYFTYKAVK